MSETIEKRLSDLGVTLPVAAAPAANYVPYCRTGNLLFTAGQLPLKDGKLQARGNDAVPFELCGDKDDSCHIVPGHVVGNRIVLPADASATRVRYCWADSPICTVADASLPAPPFELSIN